MIIIKSKKLVIGIQGMIMYTPNINKILIGGRQKIAVIKRKYFGVRFVLGKSLSLFMPLSVKLR